MVLDEAKISHEESKWAYLIYEEQENIVMVFFYIDDLLVIGQDIDEIDKFKAKLEIQFEMSSLDKVSYILSGTLCNVFEASSSFNKNISMTCWKNLTKIDVSPRQSR